MLHTDRSQQAEQTLTTDENTPGGSQLAVDSVDLKIHNCKYFFFFGN